MPAPEHLVTPTQPQRNIPYMFTLWIQNHRFEIGNSSFAYDPHYVYTWHRHMDTRKCKYDTADQKFYFNTRTT